MDRGAWRATVHGVVKSQTQPSNSAQPSTQTFKQNLDANSHAGPSSVLNLPVDHTEGHEIR